MSETWMTIAEVASVLGYSTKRAYDLARDRAIPTVRIGRRVYVPRAAFAEWVARLSAEALASVRGDDHAG